MDKKIVMSLVFSSATVTGLLATQADAVNGTCQMTTRLFPGANVTDTVKALCQRTSLGRGATDATFVAKNQNGTKTLSVSKACCSGSATIEGLDGSNNPIAGCTLTVSTTSSSSVTCNSAVRWRSSMQSAE